MAGNLEFECCQVAPITLDRIRRLWHDGAGEHVAGVQGGCSSLPLACLGVRQGTPFD